MKFKGVSKNSGSQAKKKAKPKSTLKINIGKLNNKKNNKLAKQGLKPKKKKDKNTKNVSKSKVTKHEKEQPKISDDEQSDSVTEEEIDLEDTSCFDDLKSALAFSQADLSLETKDNARSRKRKRGDEDGEEKEEEYEQKVRTFATEEEKGDMKMMLPIISDGKVIKQMAKKEIAPGGEEEVKIETVNVTKETEKKASDLKQEEAEYVKTLNGAQLYAYRDSKLKEKKATISALSHAIIEDPQNNVSKLKELRLLLGETDMGVSLTVRKYAMISLMEVFKDIVPGYRMRIPTEKETLKKLKQETKALIDYEASFLLNYRIYLEYLEVLAKLKPIPPQSFLTKNGIHNLKVPGSCALEMGAIAVRCLSEMLVNHPHFNYRTNIVNTLVHYTNHGKPEYSKPACDAVKKIFRTDKKGDVILEIVRAMGRMVKRLNYAVRPQVLLTFLALKIKDVDFSSINTKVEKMSRAERIRKFSRRERKRMKLKSKVEKEMLETKATEDKSQILKLHTQIIQAVFETYIRVIKLASDSDLLGPVLEGLAQFAHLINIEYFDSLFAAFTRLIESGDLTTRETLHCILTAFTILSGQGSVLNIDPSNFYKNLYAALMTVHLGTSDDTALIILECLDIMISKRRKQISHQRVLAFMKRLCSLSLQQAPETVIGYLASVRSCLHTYKSTDVLVDTDVQGSGIYLPHLEDPEHCCANNTSLWELHLLRHHYEPDVQRYSEHILKAAPLAGEHHLASELSRKSAKDLYKMYHDKEIFSDKISETCAKKKKPNRNKGFVDPEFEKYTDEILKSVVSGEEDSEQEDSLMDVS